MVPVALVEMPVRPATAAMAEAVVRAGRGCRARPRWFRAARAARAQLAAMAVREGRAAPGDRCRATVAMAVRVVPRVTAVRVAVVRGEPPEIAAALVVTAVRVELVAPEVTPVYPGALAPPAPMATVVLPATVAPVERVVLPG